MSVFRRSGSTWRRGAGLTTATGEGFGSRVALSADGDTALITRSGPSVVREGAGEGGHLVYTALVYTHSGSSWTEQSELLSSEGSGSGGGGVALSADASTALVGPRVFTRSGSTWSQQGEELTANEEILKGYPGAFGQSVALSGDGNTAHIGGPGDDGRVGAVWVFERSGSIWTQPGQKLSVGDRQSVLQPA